MFVRAEGKTTMHRNSFVDPWNWTTGAADGRPLAVLDHMGRDVCECASPLLAEAIASEHNAGVASLSLRGGQHPALAAPIVVAPFRERRTA
jgi:hypothetical protein